MAVKRQAAEKEVELLRRAVEESVTLARVEEDEEGLDRDTLAQNEVQDVADVDNSDPDEAEEEDDDLGNLREINSKFRPFRDNISDRMETASVSEYAFVDFCHTFPSISTKILSTPGEKLFYNCIYYPPGCSEGEGKKCP